jgi:hypothetical protein
MLNSFRPVAKALIAFLTPGAVAIGAAMQAGTPGGTTITAEEIVGALIACILTGGAVWLVPNTDPKGERQEQSVQPPDVEHAPEVAQARESAPEGSTLSGEEFEAAVRAAVELDRLDRAVGFSPHGYVSGVRKRKGRHDDVGDGDEYSTQGYVSGV